MSSFTQDQINELYSAMITRDSAIIEMMTKAAMNNAADISCDMWADAPNAPVPDTGEVRNVALNLTTDMFSEFNTALTDAIKTCPVKVNIRLIHSLSTY